MMRWLGVRDDERRLVAWLAIFFAVVQASHGLGANAADALFFLRFGVESLPLMIFLAGPAIMALTLAHGAGLAAFGTARWLRLATLLGVAWAIVEWVLVLVGGRLAYPVVWISTQVIVMVTYTIMWNAAGAACTTRQAKRLFPIFATAGIAGGVVGNLLTGPLAAALGTQNLLLVQGSLLLAAALVLKGSTALFAEDRSEGAVKPLTDLGRLVRFVRGNRFTRVAASIAVGIASLFYLIYFPFSEAVANSFATEAEVAGFLGVFSSVATAVTFLFSLLATNRLFSRLGLVGSLMALPVVYAGGFLVWLGSFSLVTATIVRGLQWVTVNAVGGTAFTALFNVMTGQRRSQIVAFMTAVPTQIGTAVGGLLLLATRASPPRFVFVLGLAVAGVCLTLVIRLRGLYRDEVIAAVRKGVTTVLETPAQGLFTPEDAEAKRAIGAALADARPQARAMAARSLARLGDASAVDQIATLLADPDPTVRAAAFGSVCSLAPERISRYAARGLEDDSPEVRLQVVRYLGGIAGEPAGLVELALDDPDPVVRAAAATAVGGASGEPVLGEMLDDHDPVVVAAALREISTRRARPPDRDLTPFLEHSRIEVRRWAVSAQGRVGGNSQALEARIEDASPQVRKAAAEALATTEHGRRILIEVLASGSVIASEAALQALTPVEDYSQDFVDWAVGEAERAAYLEAAADAIDGEGNTAPARYLVRVLRMRADRLVQWVLQAMTTEQTKTSMRVISRGITSKDQEVRSQAIEAIEALGIREVSSVLLPLLEKAPDIAQQTWDQTIADLTEDFDPWISRLARLSRTSAENGDVVPTWDAMDGLAADTLGPIERVLALQRVHMFSALDPEDLERIAAATREVRYDPGDVVFAEGRTGDEMLLIIGGEVDVTTVSGDRRRHIETYGPGEPVGELALLTGAARSADVHAGDEGVHGLLLSGTDLSSVLAERPEVAMRMLATLAQRLARQTPTREPNQASK